MSLIGNGGFWLATPGLQIGATAGVSYQSAAIRGAFNTANQNRACFLGATFTSKKSAMPSGYTPGNGAWVMPMRGGEMASRFEVEGTGALAALNLAGGKNAVAALTGVGSLSATGQLIVSAVAALSGAGTLTAAMKGKLEAAATLAGSGNLSGAIGAVASVVSALVGAGSLTATAKAKGNMVANISPFTDLSPQSLAAAVWNALVIEYQDAGTMGLLLGEAGGGSSPSTIADAVWAATLPDGYAIGTAGNILGNVKPAASASAALNAVPIAMTVTTGIATGVIANAHTLDDVFLILDDVANVVDATFEFNVGAGIPVSAGGHFNLTGANDSATVTVWDWVTSLWDGIGTINGVSSQNNHTTESFVLHTSHVGTGVDVGRVLIRFVAGATNPRLSIDLIYVGYAIISPSADVIADAVWDEVTAGHVDAGSFGRLLGVDLYTAKVLLVDDDTAGFDRYVVSWFKNGQALAAGVTLPTIRVVSVATGSDLIASQAMAEIGGVGRFRFDASGVDRVVSGAAYLAIVGGIIDGALRSWDQPVGKDKIA